MGIVFNRSRSPVKTIHKQTNHVDTEEYRTRMDLLYEIAHEAGSVSAISELLERILRVTQQTLDASAAVLFLLDEKNNEVYSHSQVVLDEEGTSLQELSLPMDSGITGWVVSNAVAAFSDNPVMDHRFNPDIDEAFGFNVRSILAVPVMRRHKVIGVLETFNKNGEGIFDEKDARITEGFASTEALVLLVSMAATAIENINSIVLDQALLQGYRSTAEAWASAVDSKDLYAFAHSRRVAEYTMMAAGYFNLTPQQLQDIEYGALFHDIGKIGVDSSILCKPGPLTDIEWLVMHEHSRKGAEIVSGIPFLREAEDIVLYHHERYDGTGYPENLAGSDIPLGARLVSVADAFDTITTDHSYREAQSVEAAINELIEGIGTQFCPEAVEAFVSSLRRKQTGFFKYKVSNKKVEINNRVIEKPVKSSKKYIDNHEEYQGDIRLVIPLATGSREIRRFKEQLENIEAVKIIMTGVSEEEGYLILLSVQEPTELLYLISKISVTETVRKQGKDIAVDLAMADY